MMRQAVQQLLDLGPLKKPYGPPQYVLYRSVIDATTKPLSDEEARAVIGLLPGDHGSYGGIAWDVLGLVESAPGWPMRDCLNDSNPWLQQLRERAERKSSDEVVVRLRPERARRLRDELLQLHLHMTTGASIDFPAYRAEDAAWGETEGNVLNVLSMQLRGSTFMLTDLPSPMPSRPSDLVLHVNRLEATILMDALYMLGEHQAAGASIPQGDKECQETIQSVISALNQRLETHESRDSNE